MVAPVRRKSCGVQAPNFPDPRTRLSSLLRCARGFPALCQALPGLLEPLLTAALLLVRLKVYQPSPGLARPEKALDFFRFMLQVECDLFQPDFIVAFGRKVFASHFDLPAMQSFVTLRVFRVTANYTGPNSSGTRLAKVCRCCCCFIHPESQGNTETGFSNAIPAWSRTRLLPHRLGWMSLLNHL